MPAKSKVTTKRSKQPAAKGRKPGPRKGKQPQQPVVAVSRVTALPRPEGLDEVIVSPVVTVRMEDKKTINRADEALMDDILLQASAEGGVHATSSGAVSRSGSGSTSLTLPGALLDSSFDVTNTSTSTTVPGITRVLRPSDRQELQSNETFPGKQPSSSSSITDSAGVEMMPVLQMRTRQELDDSLEATDLQDYHETSEEEDTLSDLPEVTKSVSFATGAGVESKQSPSQGGKRPSELTKRALSYRRASTTLHNDAKLLKKRMGRSHFLFSVPTHVMNSYDDSLRKYSLINAVFGTISIIFVLILNQIIMEDGQYSAQLSKQVGAVICKLGISACTVVICISLFLYYRTWQDLERLHYGGNHRLNFFSHNTFRWFLLELGMNAFHGPVFADVYLPFAFQQALWVDKANIACLIRLYHWSRVVRDQAPLHKLRRWIVLMMNIEHPDSNTAGLQFGVLYVFKHYYHRSPWWFHLWATTLVIALFSYGIYVAERVENPEAFSIPTLCIYFVSMSLTMGIMGDDVPITNWGRFTTMMLIFVGLILNATLINTVVDSFFMSESERHGSNMVLKRKYRDMLLHTESILQELDRREQDSTASGTLLTLRDRRGKQVAAAATSDLYVDVPAATATADASGGGGRTADKTAYHRRSTIKNLKKRGFMGIGASKNTLISLEPDYHTKLPSGMLGLLCVPDPVQVYSSKIKHLKKLRVKRNEGRGKVALADKISYLNRHVKEIETIVDQLNANTKVVQANISSIDEQFKVNRELHDGKRIEVGGPVVKNNRFHLFNDQEEQVRAAQVVAAQNRNSSRGKASSLSESKHKAGEVTRSVIFGDDEGYKEDQIDPELASIDEARVQEYDATLQHMDWSLCVVTGVSIVLTVLLLEIGYKPNNPDPITGRMYQNQPLTDPIKWVLSFCTLLTLIGVYKYYQYKVEFDAIIFKARGRRTPLSIWNSDRLPSMLFELFICFLHAPPYCETVTHNFFTEEEPFIYDRYNTMILFRLYFFVRLYAERSHVYRWRQWVLKEAKFRKNSPNIIFDTFFSLKVWFTTAPLRFVFTAAIAATVLFSYCLYIVERESQPESFGQFGIVVYFTFVTMTTVGYGDFVPVTTLGRSFAVLSAVIGISLSALLITGTIQTLALTVNESIATSMISHREVQARVHRHAATALQYCWAKYLFRKRKSILFSLRTQLQTSSKEIEVQIETNIVNALHHLRTSLNDLKNLQPTQHEGLEALAHQISGEMQTITTKLTTMQAQMDTNAAWIDHRREITIRNLKREIQLLTVNNELLQEQAEEKDQRVANLRKQQGKQQLPPNRDLDDSLGLLSPEERLATEQDTSNQLFFYMRESDEEED